MDNLPVDNQHIDDLDNSKIYYFKDLLRDGRPMSDEEIEEEIATFGENREVLYGNNDIPIGFIELWKEKDDDYVEVPDYYPLSGNE